MFKLRTYRAVTCSRRSSSTTARRPSFCPDVSMSIREKEPADSRSVEDELHQRLRVLRQRAVRNLLILIFFGNRRRRRALALPLRLWRLRFGVVLFVVIRPLQPRVLSCSPKREYMPSDDYAVHVPFAGTIPTRCSQDTPAFFLNWSLNSFTACAAPHGPYTT